MGVAIGSCGSTDSLLLDKSHCPGVDEGEGVMVHMSHHSSRGEGPRYLVIILTQQPHADRQGEMVEWIGLYES